MILLKALLKAALVKWARELLVEVLREVLKDLLERATRRALDWLQARTGIAKKPEKPKANQNGDKSGT